MVLKRLELVVFVLLMLLGSTRMPAQSFQGLDAVKLVNAVNGDSVSLDHKSSGPLVVIIFTSNYCPYSRKYEDRIKNLYQEFSQKDVNFILVNPNNGPDDNLEEMRKKANSLGFAAPYLKDHEQVLTEIMGATRTPEAFLLKPVNNGFELIYRGAIDDNPQTSLDVEANFLRTAIQNALRGNPIEQAEERVIGCIIKK